MRDTLTTHHVPTLGSTTYLSLLFIFNSTISFSPSPTPFTFSLFFLIKFFYYFSLFSLLIYNFISYHFQIAKKYPLTNKRKPFVEIDVLVQDIILIRKSINGFIFYHVFEKEEQTISYFNKLDTILFVRRKLGCSLFICTYGFVMI